MGLFDYIHSVDNQKLADALAKQQLNLNRNLNYFIQVNIGNEVQKNGIDKENLAPFLASCKKNFDLDIIGLMCIPPNDDKTELYFREMQELNKKFGLSDLSMGMSSDYISAIDNGATYIRVGSKIFGERSK